MEVLDHSNRDVFYHNEELGNDELHKLEQVWNVHIQELGSRHMEPG